MDLNQVVNIHVVFAEPLNGSTRCAPTSYAASFFCC